MRVDLTAIAKALQAKGLASEVKAGNLYVTAGFAKWLVSADGRVSLQVPANAFLGFEGIAKSHQVITATMAEV